jgi:MFS transporter, ACS family, tartrate transporter
MAVAAGTPVGVPMNEAVQPNNVMQRARRRIFRRTMPFLFTLFVIAFLDRVNVGFAKLKMAGEINLTDEMYGFGAGIFFIGYFVLEIPGSLIAERWSARKWIARIMISWGLLSVFTGLIHTPTQFYWARFFLGAAEAGFFPGVIVYLNHWFRQEDRAKAVALFMMALPITSIVGSPISGLILDHVHWFGLDGWRWVFIIEGLPAIVFGIATIFYLTDWPREAKWLMDDEREWIERELASEQQAKKALRSHNALAAFKHRDVILLALVYFLGVTAFYGFTLWLPTLVDRLSGLSKFKVTLIAAIPYCFALVSMLSMGWSSDRTKERRWHTALPLLIGTLGLFATVATQQSLVLSVAMFCLAAIGLYGYLPSFWTLPTRLLTESAAAMAIGLINSFGNLGGFVGPYVVGYLKDKTHSGTSGMLYLAASAFAATIIVVSLPNMKQPKQDAAKR